MKLVAPLLLCLLAASPAHAAAPGLTIRPEALKGPAAAKAVIIDARDSQLYEEGHLPGAISVPWIELAQMPKSPLARPPAEMAEILTSRGVPSDGWVVIYGAGRDGFGEEGRLFWTLSFLGHRKVSVLDGGLPAWKKANLPINTEGPGRPDKKFKASVDASLRIEKAALVAAIAAKQVMLLDVREKDEFEGARKYGEPRGGHLPGAISLPWKQFLAEDGTLLPAADLKKLLAGHGLGADTRVVVYCTGGVRSGFAFLALKAAGIKTVANYDGSFWEWAADKTLALEGGKP